MFKTFCFCVLQSTDFNQCSSVDRENPLYVCQTKPCTSKSSMGRQINLRSYVIMRVSSPGSPNTPSTYSGEEVNRYLSQFLPSSKLSLRERTRVRAQTDQPQIEPESVRKPRQECSLAPSFEDRV